MVDIASALDTWWKLSSALSGGMVGLFLLGLIGRRVGNRAAIGGVIAGLLVIGWMTLSQLGWLPAAVRTPLHPYLVIVVGTATILVTGLLFAAVAPREAVTGSSSRTPPDR
jgi:SSS family solute:Na+ symporter